MDYGQVNLSLDQDYLDCIYYLTRGCWGLSIRSSWKCTQMTTISIIIFSFVREITSKTWTRSSGIAKTRNWWRGDFFSPLTKSMRSVHTSNWKKNDNNHKLFIIEQKNNSVWWLVCTRNIIVIIYVWEKKVWKKIKSNEGERLIMQCKMDFWKVKRY